MAFADIPGNDKIKAILRSALRRDRKEGRPVVLPTLLLAGAEGAGQREIALELAKAVNCETRGDDACDTCASCRKIDADLHPDVIDIKQLPRKKDKDEAGGGSESPDAEDGEESEANGAPEAPSSEADRSSEKFYINQVREAIKLASMKPMIGAKRFFLIDDASRMEPPVANALLKILEEPPDFVQFILIASNVDLLLPTIVSRCQMLSFAPVPYDDLAAVLRSRGFEEADARAGAGLARGNYRLARTMDWETVRGERVEAWRLFRAIMSGDNAAEFLRLFGSAAKPSRKKKEEQNREWKTMLALFGGFGRDILAIAETGGTAGLFNPEFEDGLRELAPVVGPARALRLVRAVASAIASVDENLNRRLQASVLFARMTG